MCNRLLIKADLFNESALHCVQKHPSTTEKKTVEKVLDCLIMIKLTKRIREKKCNIAFIPLK